MDGAYCGVVFKSTLEKLKAEGDAMDISKMGIRLMRKDDLVSVSSSSRGARSPENFQAQFKPIRPPSSVHRIVIFNGSKSLIIFLNNFRFHWLSILQANYSKKFYLKNPIFSGFRILCEKRNRVHLLRISTLGKLLSDHPLPINLDALCQNTNENDFLPTVENFGDVN